MMVDRSTRPAGGSMLEEMYMNMMMASVICMAPHVGQISVRDNYILDIPGVTTMLPHLQLYIVYKQHTGSAISVSNTIDMWKSQ